MPLDTSSKRRSSVGILQPWQLAPPSPTDTPSQIGQADQQHGAWGYSGILSIPLPVPPVVDLPPPLLVALPSGVPGLLPGRALGCTVAVLLAQEAVALQSRLVAVGMLAAGTRIVDVVYTCTIAFGTTGGLAAVDIGDGVVQDRWGQGVGITQGARTGFGYGPPGVRDMTTLGHVWVSAVGGTFDSIGACTLTVYWERVTVP